MTITAQSKAKLMQFQRGRAREVRAARPDKQIPIRATDERIGEHEVSPHYRAMQIVPVINTLLKKGRLTYEEHAALYKYDQLHCSKYGSEYRSNLAGIGHIRGDGGDPRSIMDIKRNDAVDYMARELGSLRPIVDAIAIESITLTEWLSRQGRTRIKCETKRGTKVCKVYADKRWLDMALMELKLGAQRIMSY